MIDPFTLMTGTAGLISLAIEVIKITSEFASSVKGAAAQVHDLLNELIALKDVIQQFDTFVKSQDSLGPFAETCALISTVQYCTITLKQLYETLRRLTEGGKLRRGLHALEWPYKESKIKEIILSIHRCAQTFQLALTVDLCQLMSQTMDTVEKTLELQIQNLSETQKLIGIANEGVANSLAARQNAAELFRLLSTTSEDVSNISNGLNTLLDGKQNSRHKKILRWLTTSSPSEKHNDAQKQRSENTGEWIFKSDHFKKWVAQPGSLLWIHGIVGCGKTIICSTIIETLRHQVSRISGSLLVYFYFDFGDQTNEKQKAEGFLRSVLRQLSLQTLHTHVLSLYEECNDGDVIASEPRLRETLKLVLRDVSAVFVVVDALDECDERSEMIDLLILLKAWGSANTHIMVSSRQEPDIKEGLLRVQPLQIDMTQEMIHHDIERFVEKRISRSQRLSRWCKKAEVSQKLHSTLLKGSNGMFRWVSCHLDGLEKCVTLGALYRALSRLPTGLDKTYERILLSLDPSHKPLVTRIMQWLLFSRCPLTIEAVAEALAFSKIEEQEDLDTEIGSNELSDPSDILYMCSSLVKTVYRQQMWYESSEGTSIVEDDSDIPLETGDIHQEHRWGEEDESRDHSAPIKGEAMRFLQLAHASVKDYLLSSSSIIGSGTFGFSLLSNMVLAETCITYLLQFSFWGALKSSFRHEKPLALYAARFWSIHARHSIGCTEWRTLGQKCKQLLCPPKEEYLNWLRLRKPDISQTFNKYPAPICLMTRAGLTPIVEQLLEDGADPDGLGDEGETSLYAAALLGYMDLVELLLANGASVRGSGSAHSFFSEGPSPLAAAAGKGHLAVVQSLIAADEGRLAHKEDQSYLGEALYEAAAGGHRDCALSLLKIGADLAGSFGRFGTAVHVAIIYQHFELVPLFIEHDASVISIRYRRKSLLDYAVMNHSVVTTKLLLEAGADVEGMYSSHDYSTHKDPGTPLCQAASIGSLPLVDILLDHGALINRCAGSCGSALGSALWEKQFVVAKHLLDMGADPNAASGAFGTPLSFTISAGETAMVRLLIERGAEVEGDTYAFAAAGQDGDIQMLELLLTERETYVVTNAHPEAYGSALQNACGHGNLNAARILLDRGIDPNNGGISLSIHDEYSSPLEAAAFKGNLPVVRLLVERGADINKRGLNYTALSRAVDEQDEEMVLYLLQNGARDLSCLPVAVENRSIAITKQLLEHGMDVNARDDHHGRTALHWAAEHGDTDMVSLLLQYKADTSVRLNDRYYSSQHTAFHLAVKNGHIDAAFSILAEQGRSTVNLPDSDGNTPLHLAASAGQSNMVDALLALAETAQMTNNEGETALHMIALSGNRGRYDPEENYQFHSAPYPVFNFESAEEQEEPVDIPGIRIATSLMAFYDRVDIQDKRGVTPLMRLAGSSLGRGSERWGRADNWKVSRDDEKLIDCMIQHGARFDQRDPSGKTLLHYAASLGCESRVRWLLERKDWRNLDCRDNNGRTPLSWACETQNQAVLRLLLSQEVNCNDPDNDDWTPIERAAAQRDESTMKLLFAAGAQCSKDLLLKIFSDSSGYDGVHAIQFEECQCLKTALSHGADPSVKDEHGKSLLHYVAYSDNMMATELLLEIQCLDINARDHLGRLALHVAAESARSKLVDYLLENGSQANALDLRGRTALHRAADENFETLLKQGASLYARNDKGRTPLHYLCQRSTDFALNTVRKLISRGECLSVKDDDGIMPLDLALPSRLLNGVNYGEDVAVAMLRLLMDSVSDEKAWTDTDRGSRLIWHFASGGYAEEISILIKKGGSVHARGKNWRTPLHQAACCSVSERSKDTVAVLIAHGADVNRPDKKRKTALHLAVKAGNDETARLLLRNGSVVDYPDLKRRTALHLAVLGGHRYMVQVLLEAGADPSLQDHNLQTPRDIGARRNRKGIMAVLNDSHTATPNSTPDLDWKATSESNASNSSVDSEYERPRSDASRDDDSVRSNSSWDKENPPSAYDRRHETSSLCCFKSDGENDAGTKEMRTQRRSSI